MLNNFSRRWFLNVMFTVVIPLCLFWVILSVVLLASYGVQSIQARTEEFTDTNNNLTVSIQAPDNWNSGTASATMHNLNWRATGLATTNDNASAFFVIVNLPSAASLVVPLGQITGLTTTFLSQYVTIHNQYDMNFSDGSSGHAYSISMTADQLSKLQSFLPSINKQFDAVLILTQHKGSTYVIVYATDLGRMGDFIGTFQNILSSVKFGSATYTGSSYSQNRSAWTTITGGNNQVGLNIRLNNLVDFCMNSLPNGIQACDRQLKNVVTEVCAANNGRLDACHNGKVDQYYQARAAQESKG